MIDRWLRRVADWCVPASAIEWPWLTRGDSFVVDSRGWVDRVPPSSLPATAIQGEAGHALATKVEEFQAGYRSEGGDVATLRAMSGWRLWVRWRR